MQSSENCVDFNPGSPAVCESGVCVPLLGHGEVLAVPVVHFMFSSTRLFVLRHGVMQPCGEEAGS